MNVRPPTLPSSLLVATLVWVLLAAPLSAWAHDSPEHVVEALTEQMKQTGVTAELLYRRATELRVLRRYDEAAADLQRALQLNPDHLDARAALGRVYLSQGKGAAALVTLDDALGQAGVGDQASSLLMIRAEIRWALGATNEALADCERAMEEGRIPLDWYLMRSHFQLGLGRTREAVQGLRDGFDRTGSFVLETEWIEAMIDDRQWVQALEAIEPQLQASKWKSAWLVRRARARLGQGHESAAKADLQQALAEMDSRLSSEHPDLMMLADRGLAHMLMGDREMAMQDLERARQLGGDTWLLGRLEKALGQDGLAAGQGKDAHVGK